MNSEGGEKYLSCEIKTNVKMVSYAYNLTFMTVK